MNVHYGTCQGGPKNGQLLQHDGRRYDHDASGFYVWHEHPGDRLRDGWKWVSTMAHPQGEGNEQDR